MNESPGREAREEKEASDTKDVREALRKNIENNFNEWNREPMIFQNPSG